MSPTESDAVREARDWLFQQTGREPDPDTGLDPGPGTRPGLGTGPGTERSSWSRPSAGALDAEQDGSRPDVEIELSGGPGQDAGPEVGSAGGRDGRRARGSAEDPDADPEAVARAIVTRKLAAQDRTRHELASAMAKKNVPEPVAEAVLDRFQEIGLIDDDAFARRWVESRQQRRHRSRLALRRELQAKGVERDVVDEAVDQVSRDDELGAARSYADKALGSMAGLDRTVRRRRVSDRLARRGFNSDVISRVLKDLDV